MRALAKYDGNSYYDNYTAVFESTLAAFPTITERERGILLMQALTGKATAVLARFKESSPSFAKLHHALQDCFRRPILATPLQQKQFHELKQRPDESLTAWRDRVTNAAWDAFADRPEGGNRHKIHRWHTRLHTANTRPPA